MVVLKFGGSSVSSPENILKVLDIVRSHASIKQLAVVVSAFGGLTDHLLHTSRLAERGDDSFKQELIKIEDRHLAAIKDLIHAKRQSSIVANVKFILNELEDIMQGVFLVKELSQKTLDFILSFGERLSSYIIAEAFKENGLPAAAVDYRNFIITDNNFGNARVNFELTNQNIQNYFAGNENLLVIPGFVGTTKHGATTTLGRGGSDYTAAIIAAAIEASGLEIWTDVSGMMTADPRRVKNAIPIEEMSYEEALELSYFGAKIIYPPTIQPALSRRIPIRLKNTFAPEAFGTLITHSPRPSEAPVKGISSIEQISLLTISGSGMVGASGIAMRFFGALGRKGVNVILITQASSEHSISVGINQKDATRAQQTVEEEFRLEMQAGIVDKVQIENNLAIVALVGSNMRNTPGIAGKLFSALGRNGINISAIAQGTSELNISCVIQKKDEEKALNTLHESFFLSETKTLHLFVVGTGTVGATLMDQISGQAANLYKGHNIALKLIGLSNSKTAIFNEAGIPLDSCKEALGNSTQPSTIDTFVDKILELNLPNAIFVDCTASAEVASVYNTLLDKSISVVTPNKIAASGNYHTYKELKTLAAKRGVKFLFETNVGAGLPIISTLNDLIRSGDTVLKIEGIFSGTMNYLFNTVSADKKLSTVVQEAMDLGYAEPDPRIDLSGKDVARKILILARETGENLELEDVAIKPFLPANCLQDGPMDEFWQNLRDYENTFEAQRAELENQGKGYRLIAAWEEGKARVELREIEKGHPFYSVSGSDNIILFTTERYKVQPLIVKGSGAGAEVTAAGVFADIIRIAN
ncbi:bifunctional aspartate kinase/homoserine dehydrogenase I [Adhaeribacter rhizoryzae]|uniref:Bifunctional aspartate kinase/homoserine dehydrogenase I n=1 Tax=Adhaeribacter rhizoryzae TaxID=2607907 RepID=A0A5M6DRX1_9BACT|nr:bifunctional aspartate kinase/homoserine dehydrogenase I [Adhaeribacter rhizoryzae]KAA5549076.1 bifunctional aspartate kinase/homoserine dehydrogenase I [Adhaeribacter rhizoryzae]